jgi:hypothetical protein
MGTATMMGFDAAVPQTRGIRLKNCIGLNISSSIPMPPNNIATPPSTNATGNPQNKDIANTRNSNKEM